MKETFIPARKMDQPRRGVEEIDFSQDENQFIRNTKMREETLIHKYFQKKGWTIEKNKDLSSSFITKSQKNFLGETKETFEFVEKRRRKGEMFSTLPT